MNPFFQQIIINTVKRNIGKQKANKISDYTLTEQFIRLRITVIRLFKDIIFIAFGILAAGFGLKGFLLPNEFIDSGVTGISLLTNAITDYQLSLLIVIINIPFIILGYFQISKPFALKSIIAITGLALTIAFIDYPIITSDKLLIAVFGGFFLLVRVLESQYVVVAYWTAQKSLLYI